MQANRPRWSFEVKIVISLILFAFFIYLLFRFSIVIPPFILSVILAFILSPLVGFLQARLHVSRLIATFLSYLIMLALVVVIPMVLVPLLANQVSRVDIDLQNVVQKIEALIGNQKIQLGGVTIDMTTLFDQAVGSLQGMIEPIVTQSLDLVIGVISSVVWVIFILVISFHLIKESDKLNRWLESLVPPSYRQDYIWLREQINEVWSAFFRGQIVLSVLVAILFITIGLALGLPFALGMGIFAGLLEFLPSLGHGIWMVTAALLAFFLGSTWLPIPNWVFALIIIGLHLFYQQFDLNYLIPRVIGRSVNLPPLVVILGIVSGAVLAGILGVVLAAPTIASARVLVRYLYANLFDLDPYGVRITDPTQPPNLQWWRRSKKEVKP